MTAPEAPRRRSRAHPGTDPADLDIDAAFAAAMNTLSSLPSPPAPPRRLHKHGPGDYEGCPQGPYHCWGPWLLDSDAASMCLYEEEHGSRIGLWWPAGDPDRPDREVKTTDAPRTSLAFLVHFQWAGARFTAGLLNAYSSIYGLADYEPALWKMQHSKAAVRRLVKDAIDNPVNYRHVRSLSDVDRVDHARAALDRENAPRNSRPADPEGG